MNWKGQKLGGMSARERGRLRVGELPANLDEALHFMEKDRLVRQTLGICPFNKEGVLPARGTMLSKR